MRLYYLLVIFFSIACSNKCGWKIERGEIIYACCADFEEKGNTCIACYKGYTSKIGEPCRPCSNNTYGEKCTHECFCSILEKCDFVEGCVSISVQKTSKILDKSTIGTHFERSTKGPLSKDIVVYYTISAIVLVFVICVCFVVYQCRTVSKRKKTTVTTSKTHVRRHISQNVTREERVYNIIVDEDMLDDEDIQKSKLKCRLIFRHKKVE